MQNVLDVIFTSINLITVDPDSCPSKNLVLILHLVCVVYLGFVYTIGQSSITIAI